MTRIRPQFTLRTILLIVVVLAIWLGWQVSLVRRRNVAFEAIRQPIDDPKSYHMPGAYVELRDDESNSNWIAMGHDKASRADTIIWEHSATDARMKDLTLLQGVRRLAISFSDQVSDDGLVHLRPLTKLEMLSLRELEGFHGPGLKHLRNLRKLVTLNIEGCTSFGDSGVPHLVALDALTELDLSGCSITNESISVLRTLDKLTYLDLRMTGVTQEGAAELKRAMPKCRINF